MTNDQAAVPSLEASAQLKRGFYSGLQVIRICTPARVRSPQEIFRVTVPRVSLFFPRRADFFRIFLASDVSM